MPDSRTGRRTVSADLRPAQRRASRPPLPGSPLGYYPDVVRSRWFYLAAGAVIGGLLAGLLLALLPSTVTATSTIQLAVAATDATRVTGPPSSRIDRGTEEELGRSAVVAERAAAELDGRLTPAEVAQATLVQVGSESAVAHVQFRHADPALATAGADAVAQSYLALRMDNLRLQGEQHAERIRARIAGIESELAAVREKAQTSEAGADEVRAQALTAELSALAQQRAALVGLAPDGGRVISPASAQVDSGRPWLAWITTGLVVGLLVGLAAAFARHVGPRQLSGQAEVSDLSGRPVWSAAVDVEAEHRWRVASRLMLANAPEPCESVLVATLANPDDTSDLVQTLREAGAAGPRRLATVTSAQLVDHEGLAASIDTVSAADGVVLLVDPRTTPRSALLGALEAVTVLEVPLIGSFWCTPHGGSGRSATRGAVR